MPKVLSCQSKANHEGSILILNRSHPELIAFARYLSEMNHDFVILTNLVIQERLYRWIQLLSRLAPNLDFKIKKRVIPNISKKSRVISANIVQDILYRLCHRLKFVRLQKLLLSWQDKRFQKRQNWILNILKPQIIVASEAINFDIIPNSRIVLISFHGHPIYINSIRNLASKKHPDWTDPEPILHDYARIFQVANEIVSLSHFSANGIKIVEGNTVTTKVIPVGPLLFPESDYSDQMSQERRVNFTFLGRMTMMKGLPNFIRLAEEFRSEADFNLCGHCTREIQERLLAIRNQSLHINFAPSGKVLREILHRTDAYISPSYYEGFGIAALEAMTFGCIPICSSHSAAPEILSNSPLVEFIFDPYSFEDLSRKVERFLKIPPSERNYLKLEAQKIAKDYSYSHFSRHLAEYVLGTAVK